VPARKRPRSEDGADGDAAVHVYDTQPAPPPVSHPIGYAASGGPPSLEPGLVRELVNRENI
jgi:hypothetical protein